MRLHDLPKVLVVECRIKTQAASFQIPEFIPFIFFELILNLIPTALLIIR